MRKSETDEPSRSWTLPPLLIFQEKGLYDVRASDSPSRFSFFSFPFFFFFLINTSPYNGTAEKVDKGG